MMNRKAAIELSANFIIIIVISSVILVGGLGLFYKMIDNAKHTVDTLDSQTEANIKDMMLGNDRTAVYPPDIKINSGDSEVIGIGVTNIYDVQTKFYVELVNVKQYVSSNDEPTPVADKLNSQERLKNYNSINSDESIILPRDKDVFSMLLKMPKGSSEGQYTYTINITSNISGGQDDYGIVQVIVNNK